MKDSLDPESWTSENQITGPLKPHCLQACWHFSLCEQSFSPLHCRGECICTMKLSHASMLLKVAEILAKWPCIYSSYSLPSNSAFHSTSRRLQGWPSGFLKKQNMHTLPCRPVRSGINPMGTCSKVTSPTVSEYIDNESLEWVTLQRHAE